MKLIKKILNKLFKKQKQNKDWYSIWNMGGGK